MSEEFNQDELQDQIDQIVFSNDDTSDSKTYRVSKKVISYFKEYMKTNNLTQTEFFNLIATDLKKNNILEHASGVSNELRRNFDTDVRRLREATDSIMFIFMNQMQHVLVEKENWLHEKDNILLKLKKLEEELVLSKNENQSLQDSLLQNENAYIALEKDLQEKITDKEKLLTEKDSRINDKEARIQTLEQELTEAKAAFIEEKNNLNTRIVDLLDEVKKVEPMKEEKGKLERELQTSNNHLESLKERLEYIEEKHQSEINNVKTAHEVAVKTAVLDTENRVRNELNAAIDEYRTENRGLYDKIDKLRDEKSSSIGVVSQLKEEKSGLVAENAKLKEEIQRLKKTNK